MANYIRFYSIKRSSQEDALRIDFEIRNFSKSSVEHVFFELRPAPTVVSDDSLALAFATLCGRKYDQIEMDLTISRQVLEVIKNFTKAEIRIRVADVGSESCKKQRNASIISFSGGIDSLALKELLPESVKLVSMDFMSGFERESNFFSRFNPHTVRTNFRNLGYADASWTFMGLGAILYSESMNVKNCCFGTILEAAAVNFMHGGSPHETAYELFSAAGVDCPLLIKGITEVGTAIIVLKYHPELYPDALKSLADEGSAKWYRKYLLGKRAAELCGVQFDVKQSEVTIRRDGWGKNFATDFLTLYFLKHFGSDAVSKLCKGVPADAVEFVRPLRMSFYERINPDYFNSIPDEYRALAMSKLVGAGMLFYDSRDWHELDAIRTYLYKYYPRNGKGLDVLLDIPENLRPILCRGEKEHKNVNLVLKMRESYELVAKDSSHNYAVLIDSLIPGRGYCVELESVQTRPSDIRSIDFALHDSSNGSLIRVFECKCQERKQRIDIQVPNKIGSYRILMYAGKRGQCRGVGVVAKNLKIGMLP